MILLHLRRNPNILLGPYTTKETLHPKHGEEPLNYILVSISMKENVAMVKEIEEEEVYKAI